MEWCERVYISTVLKARAAAMTVITANIFQLCETSYPAYPASKRDRERNFRTSKN